MAAKKIYHATCLCKRVKFTLTGEPFHYVICNCRNCKQSSGSAFLTNAMFKPPQISFTQGEELVKDYSDGNTLSGNTILRSFCSHCGANLFIKPLRGDIILVHPSTVEEPVTWIPKKESHAHERLPWVKEIAFLVKPKTKL